MSRALRLPLPPGGPAGPDPSTAREVSPLSPPFRRPVWESNPLYGCPLAGYCLTRRDQEDLLRRHLRGRKVQLSAMERHQVLVGAVREKNRLSLEVQKRLNARYRQEMAVVAGWDGARWLEAIGEELPLQRLGAITWISATCIPLSEEEDLLVHDRIHLCGHALGEALLRTRRELEVSRERWAAVQESNRNLCLQIRDLVEERRGLMADLMAVRCYQPARRKACDGPMALVSADQQELAGLRERVNRQEGELAALRQDLEESHRLLADEQREMEAFRRDLERFLQGLNEASRACTTCPRADLCRKRVLMVGGMAKFRDYYREMVERMNGRFLYLEDYPHRGQVDLDALVQQSDIVICPVDVNSHTACRCVKKRCKRTPRTLLFPRKSSISSVWQVLRSEALKVGGEGGA